MFVCTLVVIILQVKSLSALTMTILTAPLGLAGVVPTLLIFHVPFGFNPILGLIALAGILMRNTPYRRNRGRHCTYARFSPRALHDLVPRQANGSRTGAGGTACLPSGRYSRSDPLHTWAALSYCIELGPEARLSPHNALVSTHGFPASRLHRTDDLTSANVPDATSAIRLRACRLFPAFAAILIPASVLSKKSARLSMSVRASSSPSI